MKSKLRLILVALMALMLAGALSACACNRITNEPTPVSPDNPVQIVENPDGSASGGFDAEGGGADFSGVPDGTDATDNDGESDSDIDPSTLGSTDTTTGGDATDPDTDKSDESGSDPVADPDPNSIDVDPDPGSKSDLSDIDPSLDPDSDPGLHANLANVVENGSYTSKEEVAAYIHEFGHLPGNFISKTKARKAGWQSVSYDLDEVCPGKSIGGSHFSNDEGSLPDKKGRLWIECDINYHGGKRGPERIVFSDDGLIYYTPDHYETWERLY